MANNKNIHDVAELNRFATREWKKVISFLKNRWGINEEDSKDIFQESFIVLYKNIQAGELENMTSSLSTYFISICRNKALEFLRKSGKCVNIENEMSMSLIDREIQYDKIEDLLALDDCDEAIRFRKEEIVRTIVENLPSPCNELLWGFYRDHLSMESLAEMFNYNSERVVRVIKHRCCEKFRNKYKELCKKIF